RVTTFQAAYQTSPYRHQSEHDERGICGFETPQLPLMVTFSSRPEEFAEHSPQLLPRAVNARFDRLDRTLEDARDLSLREFLINRQDERFPEFLRKRRHRSTDDLRSFL